MPTCSPCGAGFYCPGGATRYVCPAGSWGNSDTASTSGCSGACQAGFYCPGGSTSPRQNPCGSVDRYCPASSPTYLTVGSGVYTTPLTAPADQRTGYASCPADHECIG
ncbi:MAG: hypothetical protein EOO65_02810, partial [Methanosarcinales archaeon]